MTDIEQQEFAVVKAALTAALEFLVVEVNWEGFREEMLYSRRQAGAECIREPLLTESVHSVDLSLANCYGGAGFTDKRAVRVG